MLFVYIVIVNVEMLLLFWVEELSIFILYAILNFLWSYYGMVCFKCCYFPSVDTMSFHYNEKPI